MAGFQSSGEPITKGDWENLAKTAGVLAENFVEMNEQILKCIGEKRVEGLTKENNEVIAGNDGEGEKKVEKVGEGEKKIYAQTIDAGTNDTQTKVGDNTQTNEAQTKDAVDTQTNNTRTNNAVDAGTNDAQTKDAGTNDAQTKEGELKTGGKKKRQTRKKNKRGSSKRYRRKSRRFR